MVLLRGLKKNLSSISSRRFWGKVAAIKDPIVECYGLNIWAEIGSGVYLYNQKGEQFLCEVIGLMADRAILMPLNELEGIKVGSYAELSSSINIVNPDKSWLGRVLNGVAKPIDGKGDLFAGSVDYSLNASPPLPSDRRLVRERLDLGVKSVDAFIPCCKGQRLGVFSGSGIGKSMLISMFMRFAAADVKVVGLIGERSREVQELLQGVLLDQMKDAIVVVATGSESALMRRHASYLTMSIAEYFRDQGMEVLCIVDSITRFAMAQREIGLFLGELPTAKGYTPSVFSHLSRWLERAGSGSEGQGNITGLFSVLVEGDDHITDPVADSVRGILDGHIVLSRELAEKGCFPAIDVLKSISRTSTLCSDAEQIKLMMKARRIMSTYESVKDMVNLGLYKTGSDAEIDNSIVLSHKLEQFFRQEPNKGSTSQDAYQELKLILNSI